MLLADLGADVMRVDRAGSAIGGHDASTRHDLLTRGKRSIAVDLKHADGVEVVLRMAAGADALIEGFRPGVADRLGVGPEQCLARNPRLVYGRMTGWGQDGPLSPTAGHDIDYLALSGALHAIGTDDKPIGQVVDAAMVDGVAHLASMAYGMMAAGMWAPVRRSNLLDGGAPFYDTYETADGHHVAVGALEPQFFADLLEGLGLAADELTPQMDRTGWLDMRLRFAEVFRTRTRDEWAEVFAGTDACVAPVLSMAEAPHHPHNTARSTFLDTGEFAQPGPAPRFSATPTDRPSEPVYPGRDTDEILGSMGYDEITISRLRTVGAIR
jgi:alpha-methylacyl-CoA racemase